MTRRALTALALSLAAVIPASAAATPGTDAADQRLSEEVAAQIREHGDWPVRIKADRVDALVIRGAVESVLFFRQEQRNPQAVCQMGWKFADGVWVRTPFSSGLRCTVSTARLVLSSAVGVFEDGTLSVRVVARLIPPQVKH